MIQACERHFAAWHDRQFEQRLRARLGHPSMPESIGMFILAIIEVSAPAWVEYAIGTIVLLGVSMGLSAVLKALAPKPNTPDLGSAFTRTEVIRASDLPWMVIYGETLVGWLMDFWERGAGTGGTLDIVCLVSGRQIDSFLDMRFNGVVVTLDGSGNFTGSYAGKGYVEFHTGDPADTSQPFPRLAAALPGKWTDAHLCRGRAKAHVHLVLDNTAFPSGVPAITFRVKGSLIYDPRTSATAWSDNAALCARDWATWKYGMRLAPGPVFDDYAIAAANICDESVALLAGGNEKRYTCNGGFRLDADPKQVMLQLLGAMAGEMYPIGGDFRMFAGAWTPPTATLGIRDFRGELDFTSVVSLDQSFNGVKGRYISPQTNYQPSDFPGIANAAYVAEDGGEIWKDIDLVFTDSHTMAERIAKIMLEDGRHPGNGALQLKLQKLDCSAPDNIEVDFPDLAWDAKLLHVTDSRFAVDRIGKRLVYGIDLIVKETDPSIYAWSTADEVAAGVGATNNPGNLGIVASPTNLHLVSGDATAVIDSMGRRITRILATWTSPADAMVVNGGNLQLQYKPSADSDWLDLPPLPGSAVSSYIAPVSDGISYDVQIRSQNRAGAVGAWVVATGHIASQGTGTAASGAVRPSTATDTGSWPTGFPANAYDTDQETFAETSGGKSLSSITGRVSYRAIPAVTGMATAKLVIKSKLLYDAPATPPQARIRYTLDGGTVWINLFQQTTERALTADEITLSSSQDLTLLWVDAQVDSVSEDQNFGFLFVYDVRVEYTIP